MVPGPVRRFLERRRFPGLLLIAAALLVINIFVPDPLPFADEALMLIATLLLGAWRDRRKAVRAADDSEVPGDHRRESV